MEGAGIGLLLAPPLLPALTHSTPLHSSARGCPAHDAAVQRPAGAKDTEKAKEDGAKVPMRWNEPDSFDQFRSHRARGAELGG